MDHESRRIFHIGNINHEHMDGFQRIGYCSGMGEDDMSLMKVWSVRSMRENVLCDCGLVGLAGRVICRVKRQCDVWLYMSASIIICMVYGRWRRASVT